MTTDLGVDAPWAGTSLTQTDVSTTWYPPHPKRLATDVYVKNHFDLCTTQNKPCWACGITQVDVKKGGSNIPKGMAMETHHFWMEDAFTGEGGGIGGIDWDQVEHDHPTFDWTGSGFDVADPKSYKFFVDSAFNLQVLCASCHRAARSVMHWKAGTVDPTRGGLTWLPNAGSMGIHHASYPEYRDQRHNRPDTPPFQTLLVTPLPIPPHTMVAADQSAIDQLMQTPMPGHVVLHPETKLPIEMPAVA